MERLGHVVVGPGVQPINSLGPSVSCRQNKNGRGDVLAAPFLQHRYSIAFRQPDIEDYHVVRLARAQKCCFFAVVDHVYNASFRRENSFDLVTKDSLIFGYQDAHVEWCQFTVGFDPEYLLIAVSATVAAAISATVSAAIATAVSAAVATTITTAITTAIASSVIPVAFTRLAVVRLAGSPGGFNNAGSGLAGGCLGSLSHLPATSGIAGQKLAADRVYDDTDQLTRWAHDQHSIADAVGIKCTDIDGFTFNRPADDLQRRCKTFAATAFDIFTEFCWAQLSRSKGICLLRGECDQQASDDQLAQHEVVLAETT